MVLNSYKCKGIIAESVISSLSLCHSNHSYTYALHSRENRVLLIVMGSRGSERFFNYLLFGVLTHINDMSYGEKYNFSRETNEKYNL